jgi:hypothetical protein
MPHLSGPLAEFLGNSLGIAVVMLVAGWLAIRWQQDRQRFHLMKTALEKGITRFPDVPPFWMVSLRQGLTMLSLGIALTVVGGGASWMGRQVPMPDAASLQLQPDPRPARGPDDRPEPPGPGRRPVPAPNPALERWHQAQAEQTAGLVSIGVGVILVFVGVVRVVFAQAERQYTIGRASQESNF